MRPAQLIGSHADGTLRIAEDQLNDILGLLATSSKHPRVELHHNNEVIVRYGMWHAKAELPPAMTIDGSSYPAITITLASILVAWGLKALVRVPFLHVHGRHLTIELAALPAPEGWRDLWKHLRDLTFATSPGALRVGFAVAVEHEEAMLAPVSGGEAKGTVAIRMREWIEAQLGSGLPAFAGTSIAGTVALKQELLNDLLARWLAEAQTPGATPASPDFSQSIRVIKSAAVRAETGTVLVDFEIVI